MSKRSITKRIIASSLAITMFVSAFVPTAVAEEGYVPIVNSSEQASDSNSNVDNNTTDASTTPTSQATQTNPDPYADPTEFVGEEHTPAPMGYSTRMIPNSVIAKFPSASLPVVNDIDPSNLNDWFVMDTSNDPLETNWQTNINSNGLHPYWYFVDGGTSATVSYAADANNQTFVDDISASRSVRNSSHHVIPTGTKDNATITFTGYRSTAYVNFALTNVVSNKLKSNTFDIFPEKVIPHAMWSYGIMLNARVETDAAGTSTIYGYYLMFDFDNNSSYTSVPTSVYLVDLTDGYTLDRTIIPGINNPATGYYYPTDGDNFTQYARTKAIKLGTTNGQRFRLNLDITDTYANITISPVKNDGTLDAPSVATHTSLKDESAKGNTAFGPMAVFKNEGRPQGSDFHTCSAASIISFQRLKLEIGYSLTFYKNLDSTNPNADVINSFKEFDPGQSLNDKIAADPANYKMPDTPTRTGYVFDGWYLEPEGTTPFNPATGLTAITNVYAKWVPITPPTIDIKSDNINWTNKDVTLTYDVTSTSALGTVSSQKDAEPALIHNAGGTKTFTSPAGIVFAGNGWLHVDAEGSYWDIDNPVGSLASKSDFLVANIDKTAPLLDTTGVPIGKIITTMASVSDGITYNDIGDKNITPSTSSIQTSNPDDSISGVDYTRSVFVLFDKTGAKVATSSLENISSIPVGTFKGAYYFDVVVVDKAGNMVDSYGNKYDPSHLDPDKNTPETIPDENYDKKPNDPDHKVIINAGEPVITITAPTPASNANGYFNSNEYLTVDYRATADLPLTDLTIVGNDGVSVIISGSALKAMETVVSGEYIYAGTFSTKQTKGTSSTVKYDGTVTDEAGSIGSSSTSVLFDGIAPDIKITLSGDDITNGTISVTDTESQVQNTIVNITKKSNGTKEALTLLGSDDVTKAVKDKLEALGSGVYEIEIISTDNVTNKNQKTAEVYYEADKDVPVDPSDNKPKPKDDETLNIVFDQNPTDPTNKDVVVTYTITSTVRLKTISVDNGAAKDVSSVAPNAAGKYIYTGPINVEHNYDVKVTYVTYSRNKALDGVKDVKNIDKQAPEFETNNFKDNGSLTAAKGSTVKDVKDLAHMDDLTSGIQSVTITAAPPAGGGAVSATSTASTSGTDSTIFDDAINGILAKKNPLVTKYNVTVTITDKVGNATSSTYKNMTFDGGDDVIPSGNDDWNVSFGPDATEGYIQLGIKHKESDAKPSSIQVVQLDTAGNPLATESVSIIRTYNGQHYTSNIVKRASTVKVMVIINGDTANPIILEIKSGEVGTTDINMPPDSQYNGANFVAAYNAITPVDSSITITKKEIRQYGTDAAALSDATGTSGTIKTIVTCKLPVSAAKPTRIVVTYKKNGKTYRQVSNVITVQN